MFQSLQPVLGGNITVCLRMCCWKNPDRKTLVKLRISNRKLNIETIKQPGMTRFRGVIEFARFVASILKMRFTFYLIAQNIHQLETTFFYKIANRIPNYKHIPNFNFNYPAKQLVQYVTSCLEMRDNLLSKAWYCYFIYFLLLLLLKCFCNAVSLFYGHANKAHCCCCCCYATLSYPILTYPNLS